jgi:HlyD family secretion protein
MSANAAARQAEYELTEDRLNKFLEQKQKTEIVAPADGLVVYFAEDVWRGSSRQIAEGSEVYERQTIIQLPDTSAMKIKVRIHEAKTNKIAIGQRARVEVEGIPGVSFPGIVTKIAPLADSQNRWLNPNLKEYDTEITLDQSDRELKPGVTARVEILVRDVRDVLAVPVQAIYSRNAKSFAFVGRSVQRAEPVVIETGYSSDQFAEVRSGLEEGDFVLLAQDDALLAKLPEESRESQVEGIEEAEAAVTPPVARPAAPGGAARPAGEGGAARPAGGSGAGRGSASPGSASPGGGKRGSGKPSAG